jgi:hypothetical protein
MDIVKDTFTTMNRAINTYNFLFEEIEKNGRRRRIV